jgi:TolA-binding protein
VPEALLTLGNAQLESKQAKEAKKTLDELVKQFPNTDAAAAGKERLSKLK